MSSWELVKEYGAEKLGMALFKNLFKKAPETFPMFDSFCNDPNWEESPHFKHHCKVVVNVIGSFIKLLRNPALLVSHIEFLGLKHNLFKITPGHFDILGGELLNCLKNALGEHYSKETNDSWLVVYMIISDKMQSYMHEHEVPAELEKNL
jgi:hemoglobin-like flavoprotein